MQTALEVLIVVLIVDFLSGVIHWLEDSFGKPEWPIIGPLIILPNIRHHHRPTAFTRNTWFGSAWILLIAGILAVGVAWLVGALSWQFLLAVALGVNANEIHKWNHMPRSKKPWLVVFLQDWHILQTPRHHSKHHRGRKDSHYCTITNLVNPVLELLGFWRRMEKFIKLLLGAAKREDTSLMSRRRRLLRPSLSSSEMPQDRAEMLKETQQPR